MPIFLETERFIIRPFVNGDLEGLHAIFSDPEVMKFIPSGPSPSLEKTQEALSRMMALQERYGLSEWALIDKETGKLVGDCGVYPVEGKGPEVELGYDLARKHWGKGYATEAGAACLRYGFKEAGLERIIGLTHPENIASQRVLEKLGFAYVGMKEYYGVELRYYELLKDAWRP